ncbi:hypothetical protein GTCCBUS3UF5_11890 [Geobacillus thermoleovorans CCB_US3_UF5]|uniref:HNH endonuclease n=1 Tax=Geobacillus thermoleovorans CCB_US3_UF5 TaxID=1111068 RepID=A0ABM5MFQ7_GEOTH|nr:hypothetical protein GTCCBUS3UF5_11890 [Geobacillus thermoleovorans CCB_US3_UF5]
MGTTYTKVNFSMSIYIKTACQRCNRSKQERYYPDEWRP